MNVVLVVVTSTLGSYIGALLLYWLGATLGLERSIRGLSKLPLVERRDFERAVIWFSRHGRSSIFLGRLIPGVRSVISLPAGTTRMPLLTFSLFTIAGTLVWSTILIALGAALGTQYELVERYSRCGWQAGRWGEGSARYRWKYRGSPRSRPSASDRPAASG